MRAKRREHQQISQGVETARPRLRTPDVQQASASPALALQAKLQNALASPDIEERLPVGQRILIVFLLAATSWGLIGGLIVAIVR